LANVTLRIAAILIFLGIIFFVITGMQAPTSLIPAYIGIVLLVLGLLARGEDVKRRMIVMHIAVTIGLLGFLAGAGRVAKPIYERYVNGVPVLRPRAVQEEILMAFICLVYVVLCVRSFIAARRSRVA
jgi:hypothetical protein